MLWITSENAAAVASDQELMRSAFYKARRDVTDDIVSIGATPLNLFQYYDHDESDASVQSRVDGILGGFSRGDTLIFQLPFFIRPKNIKWIIDAIHYGYGGKVIALIHDYEPFRSVWATEADVDSDPWMDQFSYHTMPELLPLFDGWILHSENFKEKLTKELNFEGPVVVQGPFSYHYIQEAPQPAFEKTLIYAGSVHKSGFMEQVPEDWPLALYGEKPNDNILARENTKYYGSFSPAEIPNHLVGGFGLVWDSEDYPEVTGEKGFYTRLNYPHKLSLYLASGHPVFIWDQAAAASWVTSNHLGVAVSNLSEIKPILEGMNANIYRNMQDNVLRVGDLIRRGIYVKSAALEAYKLVNQNSLRF